MLEDGTLLLFPYRQVSDFAIRIYMSKLTLTNAVPDIIRWALARTKEEKVRALLPFCYTKKFLEVSVPSSFNAHIPYGILLFTCFQRNTGIRGDCV